MRDDIWTDDEDTPRRPRSVATVIAIAAIPWLIVAALIFLPRASGAPDVGDQRAVPADMGDDVSDDGVTTEPPRSAGELPDGGTQGRDGEAGATADAPDQLGEVTVPSDDSGPPPDEDRRGPAPTDRELAALATVIARAWTTGVAPPLHVEGFPATTDLRYAEHVVVESVERPSAPLAVVTMLVVLLEETEDDLRADVRRLAVPLAIHTAQPRAAGEPWWLPAPDLTTLELGGETYDDPSLYLEAEEALQRAGYREVTVDGLQRTSAGVWLASVRGRDPSGRDRQATPWLVHDGQGFTLLGLGGATNTQDLGGAEDGQVAPEDTP